MQQKLDELVAEARLAIASCRTANDILNTKARYLGKKSVINELFCEIRNLPAEERSVFGQKINQARSQIEEALAIRNEEVKKDAWAKQTSAANIDLSMPASTLPRGGLHPLTLVRRQIEDVFVSMGFQIADGFDIEDDFHNFDALNTPADHPSRNLADTFYLENGMLLRTQTSTVQIRVMEKYPPPIRIISLGRCYRNDKPDPTHLPMFHQVEALVVDEGVSLADLTSTLQQFVRVMFGANVRSRIRPHYFPFTEPSAEMDISCVSCGGIGCRVCKYNGWIEMGGAGIVDPNVFEAVGIDSDRFTGFAFGLGIDRIAMLKYKFPDIRILLENDLRMLRQFKW